MGHPSFDAAAAVIIVNDEALTEAGALLDIIWLSRANRRREVMMYETLIVEREEHLTWLTLNRPESLNALNQRMVKELRDFFWGLVEDRQTRVVVMRGAGRAFCAGLDLKEQAMARTAGLGSVPEALREQRKVSEIVMLVRRAPQPVIAAVHGPACGGGFALALAADVRLCGESARMNAAFIRIGLSACDVGVSYFLPRLVGASVAAELLLTGSFIDAGRAERTGLASRVVPDVELEKAARELAGDMLRNSPLGLRLTKECLKASLDAGSLEQVIAMEDRNQILAAASEDFREGMAAFLEKRAPRFRDA
jgi:enoyl-CoA hydratase/carnithine racemase